MNIDNKPKFVTPIVSNVEHVDGKLRISFLNSGAKEIDGGGSGGSGGLAEINDSITEGSGFDKHELKETEADGTVNSVGSFYIGANQITSITLVTNTDDNTLTFHLVNQSGEESDLELVLPK